MLRFQLEHPAKDSADESERKQSQTNLWAEASLSKIYTTEVAQNLHWFVLGALLPPIFVYGVASGFILLVHWLYRGFKAS